MKKWIWIAVVLLAVLAFYNFFKGSFNSMVEKRENVTSLWHNVESEYQRRLDLIPNLVNTVKGYADFEQSTLVAVTEARASATQMKIDPSNLNEESIQKFQEVQNQVKGSLDRLLLTVERYPDLKANQNFLELQAELAGTENRIKVARNNFNLGVQDYNTYIQRFPQNMLAGMYGFQTKAYFASDAGAEKAPEVKF